MDDLGNWNPNPGGGGTDYHGISEITYDSSGAPQETWERSHLVDGRNQLAGVSQRRTGATGAPQVKPTIPYVYDAAGRMTYDGSFYYEYDFFGRLVQVRRFGFATFNPAVGTQPATITDLARLGQLVVHYSYDGLGRLVRIQKPARDDALSTVPGTTNLSVTDQYFDGVRVVQEVGYQEVPANLVTVGSGATQIIHGLPLRAEQVQLPAPNPAAPTPSLVWSSRRVEREYVWAAEPGAYVDECVAQLAYTGAHAQSTGGAEVGDDQSPTLLYCLTDANANVVGLTDEFGRLVAQYSYLPYGQVRVVDLFPDPEPADPGPGEDEGVPRSLASSEALAAARGNHLGHQGLRFDRLDRPWRDPFEPAQVADPTLGAFAGVYHARNRVYQPTLGRFISDDPNGLGTPVLGHSAFGGVPITVGLVTPSMMLNSADGMNLHAAYGGNPLTRHDGSGLSYGLDIGIVVGQMANELVSQYSLNLVHDLDWATDWNQDDDAHTRNSSAWVTRITTKFAADMLADAVFNPVATLRDIVRLGEYIGEWYITDGEGELGDDDLFMGTGGGTDVQMSGQYKGVPKPRPNGHTASTALGQAMHRAYNPGRGYDLRFRLPSGLKPDAVNIRLRTVRDLKPNNPKAIARGIKQVERYRQELQSMFGGVWKAVIDVY